MNKFWLYVTALMLACFACTTNKVVDINDLEKKQTFIKIIGFIKTNQIDSIIKYYPYQPDSIYFNYTVRNAKLVIDKSNSTIVIDSIFIKDSSYVLDQNAYFYNYFLRFYKDSVYSGSIGMHFFDNLNNIVSVISVDINAEMDTTGLLETIMKMSESK